MRIGVDYYPEWENEAVWEADAIKMKEAGVAMVRVGEFAWSRMEPEEDRFDFDWLDRSIAVMHRYGIQVILGTPTTAPPNWLMEKYPDAYLLDGKLQPRYEGVRGHRCVNSPSLGHRTEIIVRAMAKRYADHPAVIGWQTDNEFEMTLCNCESCGAKFREWVKAKYGTLDNVNREWGLVVWSGEYSSWSQVHTPRGGQRQLNPSFQLDYHRFQNDSIVAYQQLQLDILREICPNHFVTHNMWESPLPIDYYKLFEKLDFASTDYYITSSPKRLETSPYSGAFFLDQTRGLKRQNFWIMETITGGPGGGCWGPMSRTSQPGFMRAVVWQSISRGADNVVQFLWRAATAGGEQLSSGVMFHHSNPPAHRFEEFVRVCGEVNRLSDLLEGTELRNETAVLYSHEQHRAFQIQPHIEGGFDYLKILKAYHGPLVKLGVGTDVISWTDSLEGYKLVVAPYLYLMNDEIAAKLEAFAAAGGTLILTNRSGVKNLNNIVWPRFIPGPLADLAGMIVEEYDALSGDTVKVRMASGKSYDCSQWADIIVPGTAEAIGWYESEYYAGKAAVTVNKVGNGQVYYIGANFGPDYLTELLQSIVEERQIAHIPGLPDGMQASVRTDGERNFMFLVNFSRNAQEVILDRAYESVLNGNNVNGKVLLPPFGVDILSGRNS